MRRKLLYLVNPISGTKKKAPLLALIRKHTEEKQFDYQIIDTRADGNYDFLPGMITRDKFTDVIICGGDGTVSSVTAYLLQTSVAVGIIPMGSGNGLALTARIPYSTRKALSIIFSGHAAYIDGFMINSKFSCMMCGLGNDAEIAHEFALTKVRGLQTYMKLVFKKYFNLKPYTFEVVTSGTTILTDAYFISISNSNQFGNYVTIAPSASLNDGLLDIVIVKKMSRVALPFALLRQITGKNKISPVNQPSSKAGIVYFQGAELAIRNLQNAPLHIDGEPHAPEKDINLKVLPNAFRLLQPYPPGRGDRVVV